MIGIGCVRRSSPFPAPALPRPLRVRYPPIHTSSCPTILVVWGARERTFCRFEPACLRSLAALGDLRPNPQHAKRHHRPPQAAVRTRRGLPGPRRTIPDQLAHRVRTGEKTIWAGLAGPDCRELLAAGASTSCCVPQITHGANAVMIEGRRFTAFGDLSAHNPVISPYRVPGVPDGG